MTAATKQKATVSVITAVSTISLGAVLVLWGFPWMMRMVNSQREFEQNKLVEVIEKSIVVTQQSTSATEDQTERIEDQTERIDALCDSHKDVCGKLDGVAGKLDQLIEIQTKAAK